MKIALILPGNIWFAPYVRIYAKLLKQNSVDYSIISWNRDGKDEAEGFQYGEQLDVNNGSAGFKAYKGYVRFIKKTIKRERFDRLIVFGPQMTCLLGTYLFGWKKKFIIDYRDLSIEQKPGLKQLFAFMTRLSYANVISSPGFKRCLPKRDYLISHNFDAELVRQMIGKTEENGFNTEKGIDVLTIGGIRDYPSNIEVVKALANREGYTCRFVGKGGASQQIEKYCTENDVKNVRFSGFYKKEEEPGFIKEATFLNIFYPRIITHDTAMSNRFYNSLLFKRPMIVTKNTTQGDYAEQYGLGVAVENCTNLADELKCFAGNDFDEYASHCNQLLKLFLDDQERFENCMNAFVTDGLSNTYIFNGGGK